MMKELKLKVKGNSTSHSGRPANQIALQPQPQQIHEWQHLVMQAQRINELSGELQTAMFELKAIAETVKSQSRHPNGTSSDNVCEYLPVGVPYVGQKADGSLIVITRTVDLFKAEREAASLAHFLRHRAKRKKIAPPPRKKSKP
jgi:hypothetical protein